MQKENFVLLGIDFNDQKERKKKKKKKKKKEEKPTSGAYMEQQITPAHNSQNKYFPSICQLIIWNAVIP